MLPDFPTIKKTKTDHNVAGFVTGSLEIFPF
jgi:hypothetical protein